jgi:protein-ribulosamine 3-kinase
VLPNSVQLAVESQLSFQEGRPVFIQKVQALAGGSIAQAVKIETNIGSFFLKYSPTAQPDQYEAEAKGLDLLTLAQAFRIPQIMTWSDDPDAPFLLLEFLEKGPLDPRAWFESGTALARQHHITQNQFGLDHDNYIGALAQSNQRHNRWPDFFVEERILPQLQLARDSQRLNMSQVKKTETFCARVENLFPEEQSALLHGDLWSGNFFVSKRGPAVFDPAVYFGHREMDLAMTKLFGGFSPDFYVGYAETFPLEKKWEERVDYYNTYPLLVHINLFEGSYVRDLMKIVERFS